MSFPAPVATIGLVAVNGVLMSPLSPATLGLLMLATVGFAMVMDLLKRLVFTLLDVDRRPV